MDIIWHEAFAKGWEARAQQDRLPHAVLFAGAPGVGKRAAAAWVASRHLRAGGTPDLPQYPFAQPEHADLAWITTPEAKQAIGIEQIRDLVATLGLTSYEGEGKVAVIEPANAMTINAANSLLKTLEEPPGNALLVLVADRVGKLPATIFSRCQRIEFSAPGEAVALAWLDRLHPGKNWAEALMLAGNAPLAALDTIEQLDRHVAMSRQFAAVASGRSSPVEIAADWSKQESGFVLGWLCRQVREMILARSGATQGAFARGIDETVLERMDRRNLFCYLDTINGLRSKAGGSFNVQLALEGLLVELAGGLRNCRVSAPVDGMRHMLTEN